MLAWRGIDLKPVQHSLRLVFCLILAVTLLSIRPEVVRADNVGGPIFEDTTWTLGGSPYIVTSSVLVMEGVTLTIDPGVIVKFNSHTALQVDGELIAIGASGNLITFTSNVGTSPGDWDYIVFSNSSLDAVYDVSGNYVSGSTLQYAVIEYAGGAEVFYNGALRLDSAAPYLTHCTIRNNASGGITSYNDANTLTLKATHNTIMNNLGTGIYVANVAYAEITDNTILSNTNSASSLGGGITVEQATTSLISRNTVGANTSISIGSGIHLAGGTSTISDNEITDNAIANCSPCWEGAALAAVNGCSVTIQNNLIAYNLTGGIFGGGVAPLIDKNILIYNQGIALNIEIGAPGIIAHNIVSDNITGIDRGSFRLRQERASVTANSFLRNIATNNAGLIYEGPDLGSTITTNTIVGNINQGAPGNLNTVSILGHPLFNDNNIFNNTGAALKFLSAQGADNLNAENNWWGVTTSAEIQALIRDWFDDPTLGIVDFNPYRSTFNLVAPVSPPSGLDAAAGQSAIDLSWAANPESDVTGYQIYYDVDNRYPYAGTGLDQGDSPIDVGNVTSYRLTGLETGVIYHFAVTAYDSDRDGSEDQTDGNESWYSLDLPASSNLPPSADFSAATTSGVTPFMVTFTNLSSGNFATCTWDFGDGGTSSDCNDPSHTYTTPGVFTISLTIAGPGGEDTETKPDYINVSVGVYLPIVLRNYP